MSEITNHTNFRATLIEGRYQAQVVCPKCDSWVITKNLLLHKDDDGNLVAEAANVICMKMTVPPCGFEMGNIRIIGWAYKTLCDWRDVRVEEEATWPEEAADAS